MRFGAAKYGCVIEGIEIGLSFLLPIVLVIILSNTINIFVSYQDSIHQYL